MEQLKAVTVPYAELANNLKRLAERDEQQRRSMAQLRAQNQALQAEKDRMADELTRAAEVGVFVVVQLVFDNVNILQEKRVLNQTIATAHTERDNQQSQINALVRERDALLRSQGDATRQIADLRAQEHKANAEITQLHATVRARTNRVGELETQIIDERQEFKLLQEQNAREVTKRMVCSIDLFYLCLLRSSLAF
jgi:uncharacterized membrane protein